MRWEYYDLIKSQIAMYYLFGSICIFSGTFFGIYLNNYIISLAFCNFFVLLCIYYIIKLNNEYKQ